MRASLVRSRLTLPGLHRSVASIATPARSSARTLASMPPASKPAPGAASRRLDIVSRHMSSSTPSAAAPAAAAAPTTTANEQHVLSQDDKIVQLYSEGGLRTILLNREHALNAVNEEMVDLMNDYIDQCTRSSNCGVILLRGKGRALCSGGDVLAIVKQADAKDPQTRSKSTQFFQKEFQLDYKIARLGEAASIQSLGSADAKSAKALLKAKGDANVGEHASPKVFVSMMDGITMGGGVGLSVHAPLRIATERTLFAMPETGIGYFPDVGVTRVLARLDGKIGQYLGMTGARISGEEAYLAGLATHYISSSSIDAVAQRLAALPVGTASKPSTVASAIAEFSADPFGSDHAALLAKTPLLGDRRIALDYAFGQLSVEEIFACLAEIASGDEQTQAAKELAQLGLGRITPDVQQWAEKTLADLKTKSPRALKVTYRAIVEARRFDVDDAFRFDMRLATAFCDLSIGRDFYEGVTHVLERDPVTKKRKEGVAKWNPSTLEGVDDEAVRNHFFGDVETARKAGLTMDVPEMTAIPPAPTSKEARQAKEVSLRGKGPLHWEPAFNVFALPSEAEIEALREGSHPAAGAVSASDDEILEGLKRHKNILFGVDLKVSDYLERVRRRRV